MGYSPQGYKELDTAERLHFTFLSKVLQGETQSACPQDVGIKGLEQARLQALP